MKTLTKKQRREIYLKAAHNLSDGIGDLFLCGQLGQLIGSGDYLLYKVGSGVLPEFDSFEPNKKNGCLWWVLDGNYRQQGINIRIICMLLCAEMCNP